MSDLHTYADTPKTLPPNEAAAILRWYIAAGVDIAIGDTPIDRTIIAPPKPAPILQSEAPVQRAVQAPVHIKAPQPAASTAQNLDELKTLMDSFEDCALRRTATQTVPGNGPVDAKLLVIGEAPGADEDRSGIPFVGRPGLLLNKMLASIQHPRENVYVTNLVPWRPPGNRTPTTEEIMQCMPFLLRAIDIVKPEAILLLGGVSANAVLNKRDSITRLRGRWETLERQDAGLSIPTITTFHPAYLLRFPEKKAFAWRDLLSLRERLANSPATPQL